MAAQVAAKKEKAAPKPKAPYAFRRVDAYDGGVGAFAARDLKRGEVILHEAPLVVATMATLERRVAALDDKARKRLFSLCDWRAERSKQPKTALGVFQANGYPCPTPSDADGAGVFLRFSRFNHSCKPNAHHAWRGGERWVFATHDISEGAELTTHYVDLFQVSEDRKAALRERFGFYCKCRGCAPTPQVRVAFSDARRAHMRQLDEQIYDKASRGRHEAAIRDVRERLIMLEEEELDSPAAVARACDDAAQAAAHANDRKTEKEWLARARRESELCEPPGSSELEELGRRLAKLGV